jgi:hypothetical protein
MSHLVRIKDRCPVSDVPPRRPFFEEGARGWGLEDSTGESLAPGPQPTLSLHAS